MGYLVFSLPMVIVFILLSFGCYVMGRNKGRQEGRALAAQELGINPQPQPMVDGVMATGTPPPPPPPYQPYPAAFPSPTPHAPNPHYMKQQNGMLAV
ncbi:hypothetical protein HRI_001888500 [Hibiscus trionum]|uniref:Uncharacterized protein n=1 Tax=Hibiscus trionum TaxID=183268 RepID=A0A9W7HRM0_HIBTR|nr:hypothetical protein HRI_001888500 [Hibiscus trionum]